MSRLEMFNKNKAAQRQGICGSTFSREPCAGLAERRIDPSPQDGIEHPTTSEIIPLPALAMAVRGLRDAGSQHRRSAFLHRAGPAGDRSTS